MSNLQFTIHRISPTEYHVNGVVIKYGYMRSDMGGGTWRDIGDVWYVKSLKDTPMDKPMFWSESLSAIFDMVEGAMRMMAPAEPLDPDGMMH